MNEIAQLAKGLAENPTSWFLAIMTIVVGYLYRSRENSQKAFLDMVLSQEASHRDTLMKVLPIAEKLGDSVEALERITTTVLKEKP